MQYDNNEDIGFKSIKKTWKSIKKYIFYGEKGR